MEKSRQIGMSWASAYSLVRRHLMAKKCLDSWIASRDEFQAKLFLRDCRSFLDILKPKQKPKQSSNNALLFPNNSHIYSVSSDANAQAGKRGSRVLDEFALHLDPHQLYSVAYPGITWGGQLEILSTHRGSFNYFQKLIEEVRFQGNPKKFSLHRVTLQDALEQGFLRKLQKKLPADDPRQGMDEGTYFDFIRKSCPDEETFLQEYMCIPACDNSTFLSYDLITSAQYAVDDPWEQPIHRLKNPCFLGIDIGRNHDLSVFWLLESVNNTLFTRSLLCLQNTPFSQQETLFYEYLKNPQIVHVCIDQSGIGRQFAEQAIERFGSRRITGITFTNQVKETLAYDLKSAFEKRLIRIPNDAKIQADLHAVKKKQLLQATFDSPPIEEKTDTRTASGLSPSPSAPPPTPHRLSVSKTLCVNLIMGC